ncbi:MAG: hypothetical protein ACTSPV_17620 [Candidatus Hodarchaeales archaeon]
MLHQLTKLKMKKTNLLVPMLMIFFFCLSFTSTLLGQGMAQVANDTNDDDDNGTTITTSDDKEDDDDKGTGDAEIKDEDDDGIDDEEEEVNEREVKFEVQNDQVKIESELRTGETRDKIKIEFETSSEPKFRYEYRSRTEMIDFDLEFKVRLYGLIEYVDSNSDGIYNESDDQIVQEMKFESMEFLPIEYTEQKTGTNTTIYIFNTTTTDGVFNVIFYVVGEFALIDGMLNTPTEIKIDIGIHNFPYKNDSSALALQIKLESKTEYEEENESEDEKKGYASDESAVETTINNFTGFFSWSNQVLVDNQNQTVLASPVQEDDIDPNEQKLYLNYPRGIHIVHDPKIGVADILRIPSIPSEIVSNLLAILKLSKEGYLGSMAVFTLIVVSSVVLYRRKRR